jgi:drug/metabolite transporter (DMT)-like permease
VLWFGLYNPVLNEAEQRVDAGTAAMLVNVGPVLIALLAGFLLGEGFPRTLIVGCAIAFTGAVVIGLATTERGVAAGWGQCFVWSPRRCTPEV